MYVINNYNDYKNVIYSQDAKHKLKIYFNGVDYETITSGNQDADDICEKLTIKSRIIPFGSKVFRLENFISKEVEIILHDIDLSVIEEPISISIGTLVDNNYVYVPMGIFNIQDKPTTDKNKTTISLRDNSVKFDFNYNAQPLIDGNGGSATKLEILQDICTQAGVTCNIQSFIGSTDPIGIYDNTKTGRQYISYIAGQGGAIPTINRSGELIFIYINNLTTVDIPMWYVESYKNGDNFKISRVVYESGIIKYESGTNTNDTLYLDASNPYVSSETQVQSILNIVNNFEINSFSTGKILGNPAIDSYDIIEIQEKSKNLFDKNSINWYRNSSTDFTNTGNSSTTRIRTSTFLIKESLSQLKYTISGIPNGISIYSIRTYMEENGENTNDFRLTGNKFELGNRVKYIHILFSGTNLSDSTNELMKNANIQIELGEEATSYEEFYDYDFKTLACNELVYNGVLIQKFDSEISLEAKQENVTNINNPEVFKKWASTEIDNVKGEISMTTGKVDSLELTTNEQIQQIQEQFNGYTPLNTTIELENSVTQLQTDTYTKTQIDTKLTDGTVTMLKSTLVTVDADGTTWDKNDSNVKTNVDADGLEIIDKTGASNEVLLEAKYDTSIGETKVRAKRISVEKYLIVGTHSRFEDYSNGTGCFYLR